MAPNAEIDASSDFTTDDAMRCEFSTDRLVIGPWHELAAATGFDLSSFVADLLTPTVCRSLPPDWHPFSTPDDAVTFIADRDRESSMCAVVDRRANLPVGLLVLHAEASLVRIGYVFAETAWGDGLASELVAGLVVWGCGEAAVARLSGGVDLDNPASAKVLRKNGFVERSRHDDEVIYELDVGDPHG